MRVVTPCTHHRVQISILHFCVPAPSRENFANVHSGRMGDQNIPGHSATFRCRVNASLLEPKWPGLMPSENGHSCTLQRLQSVPAFISLYTASTLREKFEECEEGMASIVPGHVATFRCRNSASLLESKWLGLMLSEGECKAMCRSNIALVVDEDG